MLPFFPVPYPDELFYSVLARYHIWSRNISIKDTINDLYGSKTASAVIDFPMKLKSISHQLPDVTSNKPEEFIKRNTLFPLYKPFLPQARINKLTNNMINGGVVHTTIGVCASSISYPLFLRYCPICLEKDNLQYGEPYWHRIHQVPGVEICPLHQTNLVNSEILTSKINKHQFIALKINSNKRGIGNCTPKSFEEHECAIAMASYWLLNNDVSVIGLKEINRRYVNGLKRMNLTSAKTGSIRQKELTKEFVGFYGSKFLDKLNCSVNYEETDNWLSKLVRKPRIAIHPLRHILLMRFIGLTPEEFFNNYSEYYPFGKGPWFCLNSAADHYKLPVIQECDISRDYKTGVPVGTFTCSCGFIFSRKGPDKLNSDQYKIGRIKEFGDIWKNKLLYLKEVEGKNNRAISKILKVDQGTIKNQWNKLGEETNITLDVNPFEDGDIYRHKWLKIKDLNPGKSKTELRKLAKAEYIWLYRNDREWLNENSPALLKNRKYIDNRVDWNKRDEKLAATIEKIINEELNNNEKKPVRITLSFIGKKIGKLSLLQKNQKKLPKVIKLINEKAETIENFRVRRIKFVANQIREREELVRKYKIIQEAGIRPGYSEKVMQAIEEEINKDMTI